MQKKKWEGEEPEHNTKTSLFEVCTLKCLLMCILTVFLNLPQIPIDTNPYNVAFMRLF